MGKKVEKNNSIFQYRLEKHHDELRWLYMELYQNDDMFAELCSKMYEYYRHRSIKLKERDAKREKEAGWYHRKDMLGMMLYIDNFAGNMQGVKEKIPYLKECNINCLHLMPFLVRQKEDLTAVMQWQISVRYVRISVR